MTAPLTLVFAREPIPAGGTSVFPRRPHPAPERCAVLAARRHRGPDRPVARARAADGVQPRIPGRRPSRDYDDQVDWESEARATASATLFWIPRDLRTMPGFTTNVEFGLDVTTGRAVLGCPPDCPNPERNRYLIYVARRHGVPVYESLSETVAAALAIATGNAPVPAS